MKQLYSLLISIIPVFWASPAMAQKISGRWEGRMQNEFLQVNIDQRGGRICGYTYDYELSNPPDHCKAKFEGRLDAASKTWYLKGVEFFENSGSHVFMYLTLWREQGDAANTLRARVSTSSFNSLFDDGIYITLTRASASPNRLPVYMAPCFPETKRSVRPPLKKAVPVKPEPGIKKSVPAKPNVKPKPAVKPKPIAKPNPPVKPQPRPVSPKPVTRDSMPPKIPVQAPISQDHKLITTKMKERKQMEQSRIALDVDHINLKIYDNGEIDGDTVSVFYNKKLLLSHQRLSDKPINIDIDFDKDTDIHEITLYAENLGSIPPNTALIVVTAGKQRFELRSKANLNENAVLVFERKPRP